MTGALAGAEDEQRLVDQVASSGCFAKAPAIRKLLLYLWQHRGADVSEYAIALDVLNKREHFDPKLDASVRVHISRLRQKLREYFEHDGADAAYRLTVPQGTHRLQFEPAPRQPENGKWLGYLRRFWAPALACALAILCVVLWVRYNEARTELARVQGNLQLPAIWKSILKPGRLTRVVYPIPVFYHWGSLRVRDVRINRQQDLPQSEDLKPFLDLFGPPGISQSYSVSTDTMAAIQLTRFLSSHGTPLEVSPTESVSLDQFGNDNLIFLGIGPTNALLSSYQDTLNFRVINGTGTVTNREPRGAEPATYRPAPRPEGARATEHYGVVAVLPSHTPGTSLMLVVGAQTSAIGSLITSPHGIEEITRHWKAAGEPAHFEMVVRTVAEGFLTRNASVVAFRKIP